MKRNYTGNLFFSLLVLVLLFFSLSDGKRSVYIFPAAPALALLAAASGSVGAGEAYIEGYWRCSDLVALVRLLLRNRDLLDAMEGGLARLTGGKVFVCHAPDARLPEGRDPRITPEAFAGIHPAGLPGTHIHFLDPVGPHKTVWFIGYQDLIAIGFLFLQGGL